MPAVSIIVPCYNEQATIRLLLEAIHAQSFPSSEMEVIISDGLSTDRTRQEIERFQAEQPDLQVRIVDNTRRSIPAALNTALRAASGEVIVRLDAHSIPDPDYVERCVDDLRRGLGANVGGVWRIQPGAPGWMAQAIAVAASHPIGAGDARYRIDASRPAAPGAGQAVDTVPFGAYARSLVERIGPYDETLLSNEDYELNVRVRQSGGVVWLDPAIRSAYFARPTLGALLRQYARYGYWKARMLRRYPATLRWRQLLPPLFVLALLLASAASVFWPAARWGLLALCGAYLGILVLAGLQAAVARRQPSLLLGLPLALLSMHLAWGSAFLWSIVQK